MFLKQSTIEILLKVYARTRKNLFLIPQRLDFLTFEQEVQLWSMHPPINKSKNAIYWNQFMSEHETCLIPVFLRVQCSNKMFDFTGFTIKNEEE